MRICHVCNAHLVDDSRVFHRLCRSLSAEGYEVHLLAGGEGWHPYQIGGVTIHPLPICNSRRERFARRSWVALMAAEVNPDLFHVHEPELLGSMIARAGSRPVVYDVHESYLDVLTERDWLPSWIKPFARFAWDRWERHLVQRCAAIVTATDHIRERYLQLHGRVVSVRNFADVPLETPVAGLGNRDGRTCVFAGTLVPERNLANTIHALGILRRRGISARLWLAGKWLSENYKQEIFALAKREEVSDEVEYFGVVPRADAVSLQALASIGLVNLSATPNSVNSLPIKMLECMALGLPLVYSDFPAFRNIAGRCAAGIAVNPAKPEETADAIEMLIKNPDLARQMGEAGIQAARDQFNWNTERAKLIDLYHDILGLKSK